MKRTARRLWDGNQVNHIHAGVNELSFIEGFVIEKLRQCKIGGIIAALAGAYGSLFSRTLTFVNENRRKDQGGGQCVDNSSKQCISKHRDVRPNIQLIIDRFHWKCDY